jgi:drug/metabolite transporter (DMT)-like permease
VDQIGDYSRGILMALGTALIWGPTGAIAKMITSSGLSQISVVSYRAASIALLVGFWLWMKKGASVFRTSRGMLATYTLLGILTIIFNATGFMMSCVYLSVPQVLMIGYTSPIVTMAGSAFLTGEKPTPVQVFAGFMVLLGLYIGFVMGTDKGGPISLVGVAWAIVSVTGSSGQALLSRRISKTEHPDPLLQLFFSHLFGGLLLIAGRTLWGGWSDLANLTPRAFALAQYPALMSGLIAYGLLFSALKHIPAPLVSLICTMEIVFALMLTPLLVHQVPTMHEIMGCSIILAAVACSTIKPGPREAAVS